MKKMIQAMVVGLVAVSLALTAIGAPDPETRSQWNDTYDAVSLTVTNGSTIGLIAPKMLLTCVGGTNGATGTITVTTPFPFKGPCIIKAATGGTNSIAIASNAVMRSSATVTLGPDTTADTIVYYVTATNKASAISGVAY